MTDLAENFAVKIRFCPMIRLLALLAVLILPLHAGAQNTLYIPETMEGPVYPLNLAPSSHVFFDGTETATYGANGSYLGPTLIMSQGDDVQMQVSNQLGEPTTIHWHGMHVAAEDDGGPHTVIEAGTVWQPDFTVLDRATTFWYHPHLHERTSEHVYRGLAGMIIVRDPIEALLDLPRTYGVDDIPVVIQDRQFNQARQFIFNQGGIGQQGNTIVVNGTVDPVLTLGAGVNRLRLLNGSNSRVYQIGMSDGSTLHQIGSDGGLLERPVRLTRIRMAPGERAEVLINLSGRENDSVTLMSYSSELTRGEPGGVGQPGGGPASINGTDFPILAIEVTSAGSGMQTSIPGDLVTIERIAEGEADRVRPMRLNNDNQQPNAPLAINGVVLDMNVINEIVNLGDTEIWEIDNFTREPHPFHIHDVQFQILDRAGQPPPPNESGWKDVVLVYPSERVRFITRFEDFADPDTPYMYHCHFLGHEDGGMMGQFIVIDPEATGIEYAEQPDAIQLAAYPNPTVDWTTISYELPSRSAVRVEVFDGLGRSVEVLFDGARSAGSHASIWKTDHVAPGTYFVRIKTDSSEWTRSLTVTR